MQGPREIQDMASGADGAAPEAQCGGEFSLSADEFARIRSIIYNASGIYITDKRKYLIENRLAGRLRALGLDSFAHYRDYLLYSAERQGELAKLFEAITINETSFFRNRPQLTILQDVILPSLCSDLRVKGERRLIIWSAGCSTGEEPYTLAMIVREVLRGEMPAWDVRIMASDISGAVLETARRGMYSAYTMRNVPTELMERYFIRENDLYIVRPEVRNMVRFSPVNLNDVGQVNAMDACHIIFCRNVIIYFDDIVKRKVIDAFCQKLLPGGYLFVGHSESLHAMEHCLSAELVSGALVYRKKTG